MTLCFGAYFGLMYHLKVYLETGLVSPEAVFLSILKGLGVFLIWFNLVTRPLWNRRAKKLSVKNQA